MHVQVLKIKLFRKCSNATDKALVLIEQRRRGSLSFPLSNRVHQSTDNHSKIQHFLYGNITSYFTEVASSCSSTLYEDFENALTTMTVFRNTMNLQIESVILGMINLTSMTS